jgi:hypothetical protein
MVDTHDWLLNRFYAERKLFLENYVIHKWCNALKLVRNVYARLHKNDANMTMHFLRKMFWNVLCNILIK